MRISDMVLGALLLIGGGALALAAFEYPNLPGQAYGAATFPLVVATGLIGLGAVMMASHLATSRQPGSLSSPVGFVGWGRERASWARLLTVLCIVPLYLLLAPKVGFLIAGGLFLFGLLLLFKTRALVALLIAPVAVFAMAWLFGSLLRVPLPRAEWLQGVW